jgi:hypothetical protein
MASIQVSGAIASKNGVTLFTPSGESMVYGQDSWRTGDLLKAVLIPLAESNGQPITVELERFSLKQAIEQATGGAVKVEEKVEDGVSKVALQVGEKAIAKTETLMEHLERAAYEGSPGLGKFLESYATVDHLSTAQEVLKFMEKVDLPLADDGCIILYKFLDRHPSKPGYYVDHHTKKVEQRIGSRVYMQAADYQRNRNSCGVGLHVCAKDYGQYGNEILLVKVRPSDVVAVPDHESSKMRVLAYHIVAKLNDEAHKAVSEKRSALTAKGTKGIVAEIIAGQHVGVIEEVKVGKMGAFEVKVLAPEEQEKPVRNPVRKLKVKPKKIDPKEVKAAIKQAKETKAAAPLPTSGEPWAIARVGDFVRVEGSGKIPDGEYEVDRVSNDGRASRVRVKCEQFGSLGINNTLVKSVRARAADVVDAKAPSPAPTTQATGEQQAEMVKNAARIKEGRKTEKAVQTITPEYRAKLDRAQEMLKNGSTLRQVDAALGMCRKSLARHIALGNIVV